MGVFLLQNFILGFSVGNATFQLSKTDFNLYLDQDKCDRENANFVYKSIEPSETYSFQVIKIQNLEKDKASITFKVHNPENENAKPCEEILTGRWATEIPPIRTNFEYDNNLKFSENLEALKKTLHHCSATTTWTADSGFEFGGYWRPVIYWQRSVTLKYNGYSCITDRNTHTWKMVVNFSTGVESNQSISIPFFDIPLDKNEVSGNHKLYYLYGNFIYDAKIIQWNLPKNHDEGLTKSTFTPYQILTEGSCEKGYFKRDKEIKDGFYERVEISGYPSSNLVYIDEGGNFFPVFANTVKFKGPFQSPEDLKSESIPNVRIFLHKNPSSPFLFFDKEMTTVQGECWSKGFYEMESCKKTSEHYIQNWKNIQHNSETITTSTFPIGLRLHCTNLGAIHPQLGLNSFFQLFSHLNIRPTIFVQENEKNTPYIKLYLDMLFRFIQKNEYRLDLKYSSSKKLHLDIASSSDLLYLKKHYLNDHFSYKSTVSVDLSRISISPEHTNFRDALKILHLFPSKKLKSVNLSRCKLSEKFSFKGLLNQYPTTATVNLKNTEMTTRQKDELKKMLKNGKVHCRIKWLDTLNYFEKEKLAIDNESVPNRIDRYQMFRNYGNHLVDLKEIKGPSGLILNSEFIENLSLSPNLTKIHFDGLQLASCSLESNFIEAIGSLKKLEHLHIITHNNFNNYLSNGGIRKLTGELKNLPCLKYLTLTLPYDISNFVSSVRELHEDLKASGPVSHGFQATLHILVSPLLIVPQIIGQTYNDIKGFRSRDFGLTLENVASIPSLREFYFFDRSSRDYGPSIANRIIYLRNEMKLSKIKISDFN